MYILFLLCLSVYTPLIVNKILYNGHVLKFVDAHRFCLKLDSGNKLYGKRHTSICRNFER